MATKFIPVPSVAPRPSTGHQGADNAIHQTATVVLDPALQAITQLQALVAELQSKVSK